MTRLSASEVARAAPRGPTSPVVPPGPPLYRINEVASRVGLTPRAIRFYEEQGLLAPVARTRGAYRLYDAASVERLAIIKRFRDDAGFALAEIAELLGAEEARVRDIVAYHAASDPAERRRLLVAGLARVDRQLELLRAKLQRLAVLVDEAETRRTRLIARLADLDGERAG